MVRYYCRLCNHRVTSKFADERPYAVDRVEPKGPQQRRREQFAKKRRPLCKGSEQRPNCNKPHQENSEYCYFCDPSRAEERKGYGLRAAAAGQPALKKYRERKEHLKKILPPVEEPVSPAVELARQELARILQKRGQK